MIRFRRVKPRIFSGKFTGWLPTKRGTLRKVRRRFRVKAKDWSDASAKLARRIPRFKKMLFRHFSFNREGR